MIGGITCAGAWQIDSSNSSDLTHPSYTWGYYVSCGDKYSGAYTSQEEIDSFVTPSLAYPSWVPANRGTVVTQHWNQVHDAMGLSELRDFQNQVARYAVQVYRDASHGSGAMGGDPTP